MKVLAERDFAIIPVNFLISGEKTSQGSTQNVTRIKNHFLTEKKERKKKEKKFYMNISWIVIF